MKRSIIFILAVAILTPVLLLAQSNVEISGKIMPVSIGSVLYLNYVNEGVSEQDSVLLEASGNFTFVAAIDKPTIARLFISHPNNPGLKKNSDKVFFYLEKGKVKFSPSDSLRTARIDAGALNRNYSELKGKLLPLERKREALFATLSKENKKSELYVKNYVEQNEALAEAMQEVYKSFIMRHPKSIVSFYALERVGGAIPDCLELELLFSALDKHLRQSEQGRIWYAKLQVLKNTAVGAIAPIFSSTTPDGTSITLTDLRGKYVLLDFWAPWCSPCRSESPHLVKAYEKYSEKGFTIFNISLDSKNAKEAWEKAIKDDRLEKWNHASDLDGFKSATAVLYGIQAIPQNFLIDPSGKIVAKNLRGNYLDQELAKIFGQ